MTLGSDDPAERTNTSSRSAALTGSRSEPHRVVLARLADIGKLLTQPEDELIKVERHRPDAVPAQSRCEKREAHTDTVTMTGEVPSGRACYFSRHLGGASYTGISMSTFAEVSGTPTVVHAFAWCVHAHGERVQPGFSLEAVPLHSCPKREAII